VLARLSGALRPELHVPISCCAQRASFSIDRIDIQPVGATPVRQEGLGRPRAQYR
jgi:hypothetical protein